MSDGVKAAWLTSAEIKALLRITRRDDFRLSHEPGVQPHDEL